MPKGGRSWFARQRDKLKGRDVVESPVSAPGIPERPLVLVRCHECGGSTVVDLLLPSVNVPRALAEGGMFLSLAGLPAGTKLWTKGQGEHLLEEEARVNVVICKACTLRIYGQEVLDAACTSLLGSPNP